jgi:hypothetical protein
MKVNDYGWAWDYVAPNPNVVSSTIILVGAKKLNLFKCKEVEKP